MRGQYDALPLAGVAGLWYNTFILFRVQEFEIWERVVPPMQQDRLPNRIDHAISSFRPSGRKFFFFFARGKHY